MANLPAEEKNSHSRWLRLLAKEIRDEGHPGWVHTVEFAADEIDKLVREAHQLRLDLAQQTANAKTVIDLQNEVERLNKKCSALALLQYGPPKLPPHITQQQAIDAYEWLRNQRSPQADIALELWGRAARHPDDVTTNPTGE